MFSQLATRQVSLIRPSKLAEIFGTNIKVFLREVTSISHTIFKENQDFTNVSAHMPIQREDNSKGSPMETPVKSTYSVSGQKSILGTLINVPLILPGINAFNDR